MVRSTFDVAGVLVVPGFPAPAVNASGTALPCWCRDCRRSSRVRLFDSSVQIHTNLHLLCIFPASFSAAAALSPCSLISCRFRWCVGHSRFVIRRSDDAVQHLSAASTVDGCGLDIAAVWAAVDDESAAGAAGAG